jgi:hypothetical protein
LPPPSTGTAAAAATAAHAIIFSSEFIANFQNVIIGQSHPEVNAMQNSKIWVAD